MDKDYLNFIKRMGSFSMEEPGSVDEMKHSGQRIVNSIFSALEEDEDAE